MAVAKVYSAQPGVTGGSIITVEADLSRGLHSFSVVGLASKAVDEARDRVTAAIKNTGYKSPKSSSNKIIISLAPADIKKEGPVFDLPMALAYLVAAGEVEADLEKVVCAGELSLDGSLRPIKGVLPIAQAAAAAGFAELIVPVENIEEAALIPDINVIGADSLAAVVRHLDPAHEAHARIEAHISTAITDDWEEGQTRLEDIRGQESAKRALLIAAAGRHNMILVGPPGTGKTMLARAFQSILPPLSKDEALEVTSIHSVAGTLQGVTATPPFRAPHHTASHTSLVGGGANPRPGEVTLAHRGVLFLDEFPEFERRSIDALRQPLEDRIVSISRVQGSAQFPADFILVAAMNPDRGGEDGGDYAAAMLDTYKNKISGPILDRIDLWVPVPHISHEKLSEKNLQTGETDAARAAIRAARERQRARFGDGLEEGTASKANAAMSARDIDELIELGDTETAALRAAAEKLKLSPRAYHRVIKVARTIADLADSENIQTEHIMEALQYRMTM